jgi:hypothetical protein
MAENHSSRLRLVLAILLAVVSAITAHAQSSNDQSLGDVARTQRQKKPGAKVVDDDEMTRRGFGHAHLPFDCDADCMSRAKMEALSFSELRNATEEQWHDAFAAAIAYFSQDDWGQRLSEFKQEVCRPAGQVHTEKLKTLENDLFSKMRLEGLAQKIDVTAAVTHPNDPSGAEALRQLRIQGVKTGILEAKVDRHSCPALAKVPVK